MIGPFGTLEIDHFIKRELNGIQNLHLNFLGIEIEKFIFLESKDLIIIFLGPFLPTLYHVFSNDFNFISKLHVYEVACYSLFSD